MERIASFGVDHLTLEEGLYISRIDGDIITYDLRMCKPYSNKLLTHEQMHTMEHLMATILRNDKKFGPGIIYFGPMGCQTGFYLLLDLRKVAFTNQELVNVLIDTFEKIEIWNEEVPGNSRIECGNCDTLNLAAAKEVATNYKEVLRNINNIDTLGY